MTFKLQFSFPTLFPPVPDIQPLKLPTGLPNDMLILLPDLAHFPSPSSNAFPYLDLLENP